MEWQLRAQRTLPRPTYNHYPFRTKPGSYNDVRSSQGHFIRLGSINKDKTGVHFGRSSIIKWISQ